MPSHKRGKRIDILAIGSATQDIFITSSAFEPRRDASAPDGLDACFPLGSKLALDGLFMASGGGATNAAVSLTRFHPRRQSPVPAQHRAARATPRRNRTVRGVAGWESG